MSGRERERGNLESLLISVAVHLAVILLVPYVEQPILDVYPLDIAGVIEVATIEATPAAAAPAPGIAVQEVTPKPKPQAPEPAKPEPAKPEPAKPTPMPKAEPKAEPKVEPKTQPKVEPKVAATPEPVRQEPPKQDKPEVVTSPAGRTPPPILAKEPPEAHLPEPVPEHTSEPAFEPQTTQVAKTTNPPGTGQPDGVGIVPRPEYPGEDPTGMSMVASTGGDDHGVWIPKGVQNLRGRGEAMVRIQVRTDGSIESISFPEPPPDSAMTQAIRTAITTAWRFAKDSTPGRAESYYLDVRVGYDGGTMDVWVKSERASYIR